MWVVIAIVSLSLIFIGITVIVCSVYADLTYNPLHPPGEKKPPIELEDCNKMH